MTNHHTSQAQRCDIREAIKEFPSVLMSAVGSLLEMVCRMEPRASMKDPEAKDGSLISIIFSRAKPEQQETE